MTSFFKVTMNQDNLILELFDLSKISCFDSEKQELLSSFLSIMEYIRHIESVDTEGVVPCHRVSLTSNVFRADDVDTLDKEQLFRKNFLENSPGHIGGMIKVPTIIQSE